jgi:adenosylmethionine-8-amino-7-oxononanoate aminotransferase
VTNDRAAAVALAILEIIKQVRGAELRRQIETLLREELADERRQAVADRSLPDA